MRDSPFGRDGEEFLAAGSRPSHSHKNVPIPSFRQGDLGQRDKSFPVRSQRFHQGKIFELGDYPRANPGTLKPLLE